MMAKQADVEAGLQLAYRKAIADLDRGKVSREDVLVAGRGLGLEDLETNLDINIRTLPEADGRTDVLVVLKPSQVRRRGGSQ